MWPLRRNRFSFFDPGPLIDGDLQLIEPESRFIDEVLSSCRHPRTLIESPDLSRVTRPGLLHFLDTAPRGHHPGESKRDKIPSYHFWMRLTGPEHELSIGGGIGLRIGDTENLRKYVGHLGYNVYPAERGQHLAERSCRLLLPLAKRHGLKTIWITANPENHASRRTCERLGATLVDIVPVPEEHELFARGEVAKCRYRIDI
jgi:tagatose 1,6-diphosphate aldolase